MSGECEFKPCSECGENNPVRSVVVNKHGDVACNVFWCPECQHITFIDEDKIPDWFRNEFVRREDAAKELKKKTVWGRYDCQLILDIIRTVGTKEVE